MKFDSLLSKVKSDNQVTITINDKVRKTVFVASYYTEHYPDEEYFKIFFSDNTVLLIIPKTKDLYFCDDERREVSRDLITNHGECLKIDGKEFRLENNNDKQFIKKIYYGDVKDGESGCIFSDYGCVDEIWSLAILDNGEISDVHAKRISIKDVKIS